MPVAEDDCESVTHFSSLSTHLTISSSSGPIVFSAVRAVHPTTPIIILGGVSMILTIVARDQL